VHPCVGQSVTFSVYVWFHFVRYKSHAPHSKYIHWERFVQQIRFVELNRIQLFHNNLIFDPAAVGFELERRLVASVSLDGCRRDPSEVGRIGQFVRLSSSSGFPDGVYNLLPKIPICVNFSVSFIERWWKNFIAIVFYTPFRIFYFGIFFLFLVYDNKGDLATMVLIGDQSFEHINHNIDPRSYGPAVVWCGSVHLCKVLHQFAVGSAQVPSRTPCYWHSLTIDGYMGSFNVILIL
jgi:hypothetical protein